MAGLPLALGLLAAGSAGCRHPQAAFYPLGLYGVGNTNDFAAVRQAGFTIVVGPARRAYLDAAQAAGLKVLASPGTWAGPRFDAPLARRTVRELDAHPALWAWYLCDEPDLQLISPAEVRQAEQFLKSLPTRKPTALVLYKGASALDYGNITDILMVDRYPIPWLPLANFGQNVRQARLALGPRKPLVAVIQAFDWSYYRHLLRVEEPLRPPSLAELRCMTYLALALRADGLFYYTFDAGGWKIRDHPETWAALQAAAREVHDRRPLFEAEHVWWACDYRFEPWRKGFNEALEPSLALALLRVRGDEESMAAGDYLLAVNTTPEPLHCRFTAPRADAQRLPVLGQETFVEVSDGWVEETFPPYEVRVYGPLR